jgi:hypothetical protein
MTGGRESLGGWGLLDRQRDRAVAEVLAAAGERGGVAGAGGAGGRDLAVEAREFERERRALAGGLGRGGRRRGPRAPR